MKLIKAISSNETFSGVDGSLYEIGNVFQVGRWTMFGIRQRQFSSYPLYADIQFSLRQLEVPMQRKKHKKDYHPKKSEKAWQGYMKPKNKTLRKIADKIDLSCGAMYRKIGGWFEWN